MTIRIGFVGNAGAPARSCAPADVLDHNTPAAAIAYSSFIFSLPTQRAGVDVDSAAAFSQ
jgi:hypothetical protein